MVQLRKINQKMTYIYVVPFNENQNGYNLLYNGGGGGGGGGGGLPPPSQPSHDEHPARPEPPKGVRGRLLGCWKKPPEENNHNDLKDSQKSGLLCWPKKKPSPSELQERVNSDISLIEAETEDHAAKWWQKGWCKGTNKVGDTNKGCFPRRQRRDSWIERSGSYHSNESSIKSPKDKCKNFLRTIFCINLCQRRRRRKQEEEAIRRRASVISKKKSLTPQAPPEEPKSKLDAGLVEHTSLMKAAIPVLPVPLAWFCLILNVFLPGIGTILSGFFCLCMGKPRFSTKDGVKQRIGACIIDFFIGCGQMFTVLFCLVGWGWSVWWGVIMLRIAKKYRKIRVAEKAMEEDTRAAAAAAALHASSENHLPRDPERGS